MSELTYLLFLKNAKQLRAERDLPEGCRWDDLLAARGAGMLGSYRKMLTRLGEDVADDVVRNIFSFPTTVFSHDENLEKVVDGIEAIDWHQYDRDSLGEVYESLLERNATETRSGSGQYFTPRPLVNAMVRVIQPAAGETILDPAAGTGGFLIAAHRWGLAQGRFDGRYEGVEIERDTYRLCLMNLYLHGMNGIVIHGDTLTVDSEELTPADIVLANPPFGTSSGGARARREDLPYPTGNKQLAFMQAIWLEMAEGARAAVVVPDNVLSESGVGLQVRRYLIENLDLHTVLRLPTGIFYAPGVQTNVLFFNKLSTGGDPSDSVWFYDLRSDMPNFTKRSPLKDEDFLDFENAYGKDPSGRARRDVDGRFNRVTKAELRASGYDLDIRWGGGAHEETPADTEDLLSKLDDAVAAVQRAVAEIGTIVAGRDG